MIYNYNTYEFDIVFNLDDFVIRVIDDENDKIYSDVFLFENLKEENNFFKTNNIIEKFIISCLNKKANFNLNINLNKNLLTTNFICAHELTNIELTLNIPHVRKDISINNEIIELKRKVLKLLLLTSKFNFNNFIFDDNLSFPINLSNTNNICFSNIDIPYIKLYGIINNIHDNFALSIIDFKQIGYGHPSYGSGVNKSGCINYNIKKVTFNERFKLLKNEEIIFYGIKITEKIIDNLPNDVKILKLCDCDCNILESIDSKLNTIYMFKCNIINLSGLFKQTNAIKIIIYNDNKLVETFNVKIERAPYTCNSFLDL